MQTEKEINADILKMIMKIEEAYPELTKYMSEMKVADNECYEVSLANLKDYYNSLYALFTTYKKGVVN